MGRVHRFGGARDRLRWSGVPVESYGDPSIPVTRQVLIGAREGAANFAIRYFEVEPGGATSLDHHAHDHGVVIVAGHGRVLLGETLHEIGFGDVVYVGPSEVHRFDNTGTEPLGFLCVVPAQR